MGFKTILVICAAVLGGAAITAVFYVMKRLEEKTVATIPEEFRYIYANIAKITFVNFIAIDPRNQKMLLDLDGTRKMYDFADIQGHETDTREINVRHTTYKSNGRIKRGIGKKTVYDLILRVNDLVNPTWQFSSGVKDEVDCAELLVSRALDGTLPDTDERRIFNTWNAKKFKSFLSAGTGTQG